MMDVAVAVVFEQVAVVDVVAVVADADAIVYDGCCCF